MGEIELIEENGVQKLLMKVRFENGYWLIMEHEAKPELIKEIEEIRARPSVWDK